jgi:hypothetical protein
MESSREGLDEDGGANGVVSYVNVRLREEEHIVPKTRLKVMLHFREIEVRARAAFHELVGVVEEIQCKVKQ